MQNINTFSVIARLSDKFKLSDVNRNVLHAVEITSSELQMIVCKVVHARFERLPLPL